MEILSHSRNCLRIFRGPSRRPPLVCHSRPGIFWSAPTYRSNSNLACTRGQILPPRFFWFLAGSSDGLFAFLPNSGWSGMHLSCSESSTHISRFFSHRNFQVSLNLSHPQTTWLYVGTAINLFLRNSLLAQDFLELVRINHQALSGVSLIARCPWILDYCGRLSTIGETSLASRGGLARKIVYGPL